MVPPTSLARHLQKAAAQAPQAGALLHAGKSMSFAELVDDSLDLASQLKRHPGPIIEAGSSLHLARHAYACSFQTRPFFPVDRGNTLPAIQQPLTDVALIIATSGSEGKPRAVLLGNEQLDAAAANSNTSLPLNPGDLWLNCLPLYHIGGQSILWRCARAGAAVLLHDGFVADRVATDLAAQSVTHISLIGGAALSRTLYNRATAAGWPLYPSYGMSETAAQFATFAPADGAWHEGLVGRPMPGHDIRIGADGRLEVRGPQVMRTYLDGSGIDADGWLTTGDLANIDAAGRLTILGRADDMLISGGRNVHPQEVESCLAACPGVLDVAVTGRPDPVWGDLIVALVVGTVTPGDLLAHARRHLPSAALPRKIQIIDRLPRNATGKLERATLRHLATEAGH